jgi:hypothetical protein
MQIAEVQRALCREQPAQEQEASRKYQNCRKNCEPRDHFQGYSSHNEMNKENIKKDPKETEGEGSPIRLKLKMMMMKARWSQQGEDQ